MYNKHSSLTKTTLVNHCLFVGMEAKRTKKKGRSLCLSMFYKFFFFLVKIYLFIYNFKISLFIRTRVTCSFSTIKQKTNQILKTKPKSKPTSGVLANKRSSAFLFGKKLLYTQTVFS